jgi:hypothetical protein
MKVIVGFLLAACAWAQCNGVAGQHQKQSPTPEASSKESGKSETLHYNVNWPSGLSLGEGQLSASRHGDQWSFAISIEAALPGFALTEAAKATATADYCSVELEKKARRGKRNVDETTTFDQKNLTAERKTNKGGKSELKIHSCARDALTYVFFLRRELAAGRLPPAQSVYYGGAYQVRVNYTGVQSVRIGGESIEADRLVAIIKGPASEIKADMFFARDAVRTPLLVEVPLLVGKFSLELAR